MYMHPRVLAGDALPFWLVMTLLTSPDGVRQRGLRALYDTATGEFMVRSAVCCVTSRLQCFSAAGRPGLQGSGSPCLPCTPLS